ncbi:type II toxin-antitoxin system YafQ family toxin [Caproiciproducens sp.]
MKYTVKYTTVFKKDYKLAKRRGQKIELLQEVVTLLAAGEILPEKNKDHALTGNWIGHRECHILPDWLLVYRIEDDVLVLTLTRTGTHSDLFDK